MAIMQTLPVLSHVMIDESAPDTNSVNDAPYYIHIPGGTTPGKRKRRLIKFDIESINHIFSNVLTNIFLEFFWASSGGDEVYVSALVEDFDPLTVTWNTRPATAPWGPYIIPYNNGFEPGDSAGSTVKIDAVSMDWERIRDYVVYGIEIYTVGDDAYNNPKFSRLSSSSNRIEFEELFSKIANTHPQSGSYINKNSKNIFSWAIITNSVNNNPPQSYWPVQTNALFQWRENENGSILQIEVGANTSIEIPPDTFSSASVQWRILADVSSGEAISSEWITCSTEDAISNASILAPKSSVLDGGAPTTFSWSHIIETGTQPTGFDLQVSTDGSSWSTLQTKTTTDTFVEVPGDTFGAGNLYWRVRTYNADGLPGLWSDSALCIVLVPPLAPAVIITDASPHFAARWQQVGQQAYEVALDDAIIAKVFSGESFFQYNGYLDPGSYLLQVRVQNQYGFWSEWGGAILSVINQPGTSIVLTAYAEEETVLSWSASGEYNKYLIYRNGKLIAETEDNALTDYFSTGDVSYQVRGVYADRGYYTLSNTVEISAQVSALVIADVDNPKWLNLSRSTASLRATGMSASQSVTYNHYAGQALPSAEVGEAVDKSYQFDCAWKIEDKSSADAFEQLLGKTVCIKTPAGERIIGVMGNWSRKENRFWISYNVTVTQIYWDEAQNSKKKKNLRVRKR